MKTTQNNDEHAQGRSQGRSDIEQAIYVISDLGWLPTYTAENVLKLGIVSDYFRAGYLISLRAGLESLRKHPEARYFEVIEYAIMTALHINQPTNQG